MLEHQTLRKADILSGSAILILGLFIISQAFQMPMKDSWGGVQNVWFVSPALFPLFIGGMLSLLGLVLICIALKSVGVSGFVSTMQFIAREQFRAFLRNPANIRFYAIVFNLFGFVFLMVPHIDFFLAAIFFLLALFFMFYLSEHQQLVSIFLFTIAAQLILAVVLLTPVKAWLAAISEFSGDWYLLLTLVALIFFTRRITPQQPEFMRKFRMSLIVAFVAPTLIGIIFKYFLLVPMPFEGLVVQLLDSIWYADLWS